MGIENKKHLKQEQPDTMMHIADAIMENFINPTREQLDNPDAPAFTEAMRTRAAVAARRRLEVKQTDLTHEIQGTEDGVENLILEYEETGDPGIGQEIEAIKPHHHQMLVEKGNLPPKEK